MTVVFITGAGYLGNALAIELRRRGYEVYVLIRNPEKAKKLEIHEVHTVVGDLLKLETYEHILQKADVIVNTAQLTAEFEGKSHGDIIAAIKKSHTVGAPKKRLIFTSGGAVYRPNSDHPLTEDSPLAFNEDSHVPPDSPFGIFLKNRIQTEKAAISNADTISTVIRPPFILGGENGHYTTFFQQGKEGKVVVPGTGANFIAVIHINDLVEGYIKVIEAEPRVVAGQIFHFSADHAPTFLQVAKAFAGAAGFQGEVEFGEANRWATHIAYDCTKAKRDLGWKPSRPDILKEAEALFISWHAGGFPTQF